MKKKPPLCNIHTDMHVFPFAKKTIAVPERVCLRLKALREASGKSVGALCAETKLSARTIEALESCAFDSLPFSTMYKKQCIRRYAKALNAPSETLVAQFASEELSQHAEPFPLVPKADWVDRLHLRNIPMVLRSTLTLATLVLFVGYLAIQLRHIMTPPHLVIAAPDNGLLLNASSITVRGETEADTAVMINGKPIHFSDTGGFEETVELLPGLNTIVVSAEKKHGKTTSAVRYVVRKTDPHVSVK
jgi:hypothetical protein